MSCVLSFAAPSPAVRPNILFLLADDLGYGDLGCQNAASKIRTPNLDRLAAAGMRFTDAHAPSALCSPSRYSILTGQYPWRTRLKSGVLDMWDEPLIAPETPTVATLLRGAGYRTGCFGKWHLGMRWAFRRAVPEPLDTAITTKDIDWLKPISGGPVDHGFDTYFGVNIANEPPYAFIVNDHVCGTPDTQYSSVTGQQSHWAGPGVSGWKWENLMPMITSNAVQWVRASAAGGTPFFGYVAFTAPHQPVSPNPEFQGQSGAGVYGDFVEELDDAVGKILGALEQSGAYSNTVVIFTSDNGPDEFAYDRIASRQHASMGALRGIKRDIWEGGHRVPFIARWPESIAPGGTNDQTICLVDFLRTAAALASVVVPTNTAQDSVSFLPLLLGGNAPTRSSLLLQSACGQFGLRSNQWMYIDSYTGDGHNPELEPLWFKKSRGYPITNSWPALLYDLRADLAEANNLYEQESSWVNRLHADLHFTRAESIWLGSQSRYWTNPANWSRGIVPEHGDIRFANNFPAAGFQQTLGSSFHINSITTDPVLTNSPVISAGAPYRLYLKNGIDIASESADFALNTDVVLEGSQIWSIHANHVLSASGRVSINAAELQLSGGGSFGLSGPIDGPGSLVARSAGTITLSGSNSYYGGTVISGGGVVAAQTSFAFGRGPVLIPNYSTVRFAPSIRVTNDFAVNGAGRLYQGNSRGALNICSAGEAVLTGSVQLLSDTALFADSATSTLKVMGPVIGSGSLTILPGSGTVVLGGSNAFAGGVYLLGKLSLAAGDNRLPAGGLVCLSNLPTACLNLNAQTQSVGALAGGGTAGGFVNFANGTLILDQVLDTTFSGAISGSGRLIKTNLGAFTIAGTNIFSGDIILQQGRLIVNSLLGATNILVEGGELSGTGVISAPVCVRGGGLASCVTSPGVTKLTISNSLRLEPGSYLSLRINSDSGTADQIYGLKGASYGGTLRLTNIGHRPVFPGQTFKLCASCPATGGFQAIIPEPGAGMAWTFTPATGTLKAVTRPELLWTKLDARSFRLGWSEPGFHLEAQTNTAGLGLTTNWFDFAGGQSSPVVIPILPPNQSLFLRLSTPDTSQVQPGLH